MEINANSLKLCVMSFYRFKKGFLTCTELQYSHGIADVIILNDKSGEVIEVETKISKYDLLSEGKNKEEKHKILKESEVYNFDTQNPLMVPNKFYFAVPLFLVEDTVEYARTLNNDYGVLGIDTVGKHEQPEYTVRYCKQAHKLHGYMVASYFKPELIKRVCNDNIVLNRRMYWK